MQKLNKIPRQTGGRWIISVLVLTSLLTFGMISVVRGQSNEASQSLGALPTPVSVMQSQTAGGLTLTLESVLPTAGETQLSFSLVVPQQIVPLEADNVLGPIEVGTQLQLSGITPLPNGLILRPEPHHAGMHAQRFTLALSPVTDPSQPVAIVFSALPFKQDSKGSEMMSVHGPWQFELNPTVFATNHPDRVQVVGAEVSSANVTVRVNRVENRASGLSVYYSITSHLPRAVRPVVPNAQLVFDDGSRSQPVPMQAESLPSSNVSSSSGMPAIMPNQPVQFVSVFPPLEASTGRAHLELSDFLTDTTTGASFTIQQPFGQWTASPISIQGETVEVTSVAHATGGRLKVTVENEEPIESANILFLGTDVDNVTASDDQGQTYQAAASSTGMRRQSDRLMGAGSSTFWFVGVNPTAGGLTIVVPHSGELIRGNWSVAIPLP